VRHPAFRPGERLWCPGAPGEPIGDDDLANVFQRLGAEGWEMIQYVNEGDAALFYLKRPVAE
jgi:hypothetical protein